MTVTQTKEFTLPFVGREEELQFLLNEYDEMLHAQYRSVWIEAPAGMGKTTLVEEFLRRIQNESLKPWIVHAHLRERSSNSLASFVEALGVTLQTLTEAQREKLFSGLTSFYQEQAKKIVGGGNVQSMDMEEAITTAGYILKKLSFYFPLVVIIEDIHVLKGEMSFYALRHLQAIVEHVPMLMLFVSRPGDEKHLIQFRELSMKEGCKKYEVKSLKYEDVEKLVGGERTDAKKFMHLSGGNALLLRELLRSGTLDSNDSPVSTTEQIIHYLTKELEHLPKRDRQLIAIAGMLGEEFSERLLEEITESKDFRCWSDDVLRRLEQKGIIERRKKMLKWEGEEKEMMLQVSVFSHALWWEAARKLYEREKTWTDKKFAETIIPLLSHEEYPLLTDAELIVKLFQWLPRQMSFALLEYVHSLCSFGARWHFHTEEEVVEILAKVRNTIVDLMGKMKIPFTKKHLYMMVELLDAERSITMIKKQTIHIANKSYGLIAKLLSPFIGEDHIAFGPALSLRYQTGYIFFRHYADEHRLKQVEKDLQSLRQLAVRHNLEEDRQALLFGILACREWHRNPSKAAQFFYKGVQTFPRRGWVAYNYRGVFLRSIAFLPFSQREVSRYLLLAIQFRKEATKEDVPTLGMLVPITAYMAEILLAVRAGKILEARGRCEELLRLKEKIWRIDARLGIYFIEAEMYSIEGEREKALGIIKEVFSKFSWRDDTSCLKSLAKTFLMIEEWGHFEKLWQENKRHLWPLDMLGVLPLLEARLLMCSLLGNDEGIDEVWEMFGILKKKYPMMKPSIESSKKKMNFFLALQTDSLVQAKKEFKKFIDNDDTVGPFDKALFLQLFARIGVRHGHDPKEFSSYASYSLKEFSRLGVTKRAVFTAEKLSETNLISQKELHRIKKKYKVQEARHDAESVSRDHEESMKGVYPAQAGKEERGITLRCIGGIEAFDPSGKEIIDRRWGKRKSEPSHHKRIVMELVCAGLQHHSVTRKELLAMFNPGVDLETLSEKKRNKLNQQFAVYVYQLRKMFSPYNIIIKDADGYRLDPSVHVDLAEIEHNLGNVTALSTIHPPSALWQIRTWNELSDSNGIAPGIKSKGIKNLRREFMEIHKKYRALEKQLVMRTSL